MGGPDPFASIALPPMTRSLRIATALVLGLVGASSALAQGARTAPALRIVERTSDGVVVEVRVAWATPLADALGGGGPLAARALRATRGEGIVSKALDLPALAAPYVEVLAADYDEAPYDPAASDSTTAELIGPVAEVVAVGPERRVPRGTFVARLLRYDPERGTVRRYRRIVAAVRFGEAPAARFGEAPAARGATSTDNPHLAVGNSVLAAGMWFKVPVRTEGVYRIDRAFLQDLGLAPDGIDPNSVAVFGNGGEPLPALNRADRIADLAENATLAIGGGDGSFGVGDAVYFYGAAPSGWRWDPAEAAAGRPGWRHFINLFSTVNYYFVRVGVPGGARVGSPAFTARPGATVLERITGRAFAEEDRPEGMIDRDGGGSGLDWMGREVTASVPSIVALDTVPAGLVGGTVRYRARVATRSTTPTRLAFRTAAAELASVQFRSPGGYTLAGDRTLTFSEEVAAAARLRLSLAVSGSDAGRQGWIDYVEAFYPKALRAEGGVLRFHTPGGEAGLFEFVLTGFGARPQVWDVTDPRAIRALGVQESGGSFLTQVEVGDGEAARELVAFDPAGAAVHRAPAGFAVPNQNLHAVSGFPDYVVVTPAAFRAEAEELAAYRAADGLRPLVVEVEQIYNEFSGGLVDMRAVRDYLRFLYDRDAAAAEPSLRYALLFGDGHYDFRGIREGGDRNNWVPTYQTRESFSRSNSYTSDDYFALLDPDEGLWNSNAERMDIGVGRIPARSPGEAAAVVAKIKSYDDPATQGDWRTRLTFVADDQFPNDWDTDAHVLHAELVSDTAKVVFPESTHRKIYAGTYQRVQTALGARYPEAHADILRAFDEGTLIWNYSGHGGATALADERLLTRDDITVLENADRLTILVTATCSFGRYDLINEQSGAEAFLLNRNGGAAGVFTTTRLVYAGFDPYSNNLGLNRVLIEYLLEPGEDGRARRLGDTYRLTKADNVGATVNNRKFVYLGDPAMRIQLPERPVAVTAINGSPLSAADSTLPMLRALERASIEGEVRRPDGQRDTGYDGEVELTVYDAERTVPLPVRRYTDGAFAVRDAAIYRGRATVRGGAFRAEFVVPRDISYTGEPGRISAYVANAAGNDGVGATEAFRIGGTAGDPIRDVEGPRVELFLNDTTFASGGLVGSRPVLIAKLFDENGINTVGAGVGHELLLTIDGAEQDAVNLGRFYRGELDSYQRGEVVFELPEQAPGPHTLTLRAWDAANNATTATLDYVVEAGGELVLRNVYNYPNPTTGPTRFVFEHNQAPGTLARVQLRVYTLSGRPVVTLDDVQTLPAGALTSSLVQIPWDGRDEDFDTLASGIYLYKLRVEVERDGGETDVSERVERLAVIR